MMQPRWIGLSAKLSHPSSVLIPSKRLPPCLDQQSIKSALSTALENPIKLESQMRTKGGDAYLNYIQNVLNGTQQKIVKFEDCDLVLHEQFSDFMDSFEQDYQAHNLSRILAVFAWEWISKNDKSAYDIVIDGFNLKWNRTNENWVGLGVDSDKTAHEVGCIHAIQGYDLSCAYVIIGKDLKLGPGGIPESNKRSYFNRNKYATATKRRSTSSLGTSAMPCFPVAS